MCKKEYIWKLQWIFLHQKNCIIIMVCIVSKKEPIFKTLVHIFRCISVHRHDKEEPKIT